MQLAASAVHIPLQFPAVTLHISDVSVLLTSVQRLRTLLRSARTQAYQLQQKPSTAQHNIALVICISRAMCSLPSAVLVATSCGTQLLSSLVAAMYQVSSDLRSQRSPTRSLEST